MNKRDLIQLINSQEEFSDEEKNFWLAVIPQLEENEQSEIIDFLFSKSKELVKLKSYHIRVAKELRNKHRKEVMSFINTMINKTSKIVRQNQLIVDKEKMKLIKSKIDKL